MCSCSICSKVDRSGSFPFRSALVWKKMSGRSNLYLSSRRGREGPQSVGEPIGDVALGMLQEVRVDEQGDCWVCVAEPMLHFGNRSAARDLAEAQLSLSGPVKYAVSNSVRS
jgi:hypothetical protein